MEGWRVPTGCSRRGGQAMSLLSPARGATIATHSPHRLVLHPPGRGESWEGGGGHSAGRVRGEGGEGRTSSLDQR